MQCNYIIVITTVQGQVFETQRPSVIAHSSIARALIHKEFLIDL